MPAGTAPALALFDIDGTLIRRAGPHHREALVEAIRRVMGLETSTDGIPLYGMLDPDILSRMLARAGVRPRAIRAAMPEIVESAQRVYLRTCPDLERKTCPGVRTVLRRLDREGVAIGLVTGNLERIGWKKMECAGLRQYFRFGAFGGMAPNRAGLVRLAIRRARAEGWIGRGTPVALIGDAPADIEAAAANGIPSIAVATGVIPRAELEKYRPHALLEDLREFVPGMLGL
ncbi:MAG: HAD family hydrolase [Acidobacteriota bacterium]